MITAVDTNVISTLWSQEPESPWAAEKLALARAQGGVVICAPVYAELLAHPGNTTLLIEKFLAETSIRVDFDLSEKIWREAARGFSQYARRRRASGGGAPKRFLVDYIVGAHATLSADRLLTLDPGPYTRDFAKLRLLN